jgi:hypothetical protein
MHCWYRAERVNWLVSLRRATKIGGFVPHSGQCLGAFRRMKRPTTHHAQKMAISEPSVCLLSTLQLHSSDPLNHTCLCSVGVPRTGGDPNQLQDTPCEIVVLLHYSRRRVSARSQHVQEVRSITFRGYTSPVFPHLSNLVS